MLPNPVGVRTMGVDPTTHKIYLPTAEFGEMKPGGFAKVAEADPHCSTDGAGAEKRAPKPHFLACG